jgi:hypothetical protein
VDTNVVNVMVAGRKLALIVVVAVKASEAGFCPALKNICLVSRSQAPLGNAYLQALLDVAIKLSIFCSCYTKQSLVIVTPKPEFGSETFN